MIKEAKTLLAFVNRDNLAITCEKSSLTGSPNAVYEAVIEPGTYDIILTNGTEQKVLKSKANLTRGENKMALISGKNNELMEDAAYKKYAKDRDAKRDGDEPSHHDKNAGKGQNTTATGNAGQQGTTGAKAGLTRPDTTSSMMSDVDESHNRLGSADIRNRPGSASGLGRTQDISHANVINKEQVIAEDPAENDEDRFMVKMVAENGAVPFEMFFLFEDEEGITQVLSRDQAPASGGYFMADNQREILSLDDVRQREGYYRMIISRRPEVTTFSPVHVMINCNGISSAKKYLADPFTKSDQFLDYAVFKCKLFLTLVPDNVYLPINVITTEKIVSPTYMLSQIRSLINKLSESKLGIDKIFGRFFS